MQYGLFVENKAMFDDLGDKLVYETDDYPASVILDEAEKEKWRKKGKKPRPPKSLTKFKVADPGIEQLFVKNIKGLILLNKGVRKVYLGFKILLFKRKIRKENKVYEEGEEIDIFEDLPLPEPDIPELIGWYYYELGSSRGEIRKPKSDFITMYQPPLLKLPFNKRAVKETKIKLKFTYRPLTYEMASLPFFAELRIKER